MIIYFGHLLTKLLPKMILFIAFDFQLHDFAFKLGNLFYSDAIMRKRERPRLKLTYPDFIQKTCQNMILTRHNIVTCKSNHRRLT